MSEEKSKKEIWSMNERREWWERYKETVNKAGEQAVFGNGCGSSLGASSYYTGSGIQPCSGMAQISSAAVLTGSYNLGSYNLSSFGLGSYNLSSYSLGSYHVGSFSLGSYAYGSFGSGLGSGAFTYGFDLTKLGYGMELI